MSILLKTHKLLWGASGNICARCKRGVVEDATETNDASLVGEEAHIVSKKTNGPRYDDPLPMEQRDLFVNLILLCNGCHKIVDDQVNTYPADLLREMKAEHETWVKDTLGPIDAEKRKADLVYSAYVDEWATRAEIDDWRDWSYGLMCHGLPRLSVERTNRLEELVAWLLARVWPGRYPELEAAFVNFRRILSDLLNTFGQHAEQVSDGSTYLTAAYNPKEWLEQKEFERGLAAHEYNVYLVMDLMLELTRAANYICDKVREYISASYRIEEGAILAMAGPFENGADRTFTLTYCGNERVEQPYPGLKSFQTIRLTRQGYVFGIGDNGDHSVHD